MVAMPAANPETEPVGATETIVLALLQLPPLTASVKDMEAPAQTVEGPPIAAGVALTVIVASAGQPARV